MLNNPYCNLKNVFENFLDTNLYPNHRNIDHYINLDATIKDYIRNLQYFSQPAIMSELLNSIYKSNSEIFEKEILFNDNNFYKVYWNIDKANQLIRDLSIPICNIKLTNIIGNVDKQNISINLLDKASINSNPIVIALYPPLNNLQIIIDGNHRVMSKYIKGEKSIKAYILTPDVHLLAMTHDLFRTLYIIHYNLTRCASF